MLPAKEFLNKIKYSGKFNQKEITIYYFDRVLKELLPVGYENIKIDGDLMLTEDKTIPLHRIREIRYKNIIIWKR